ncbi:TonB-dependent receptor [uncultured Desulfobacter sp.]|uniref:TonB-dependent receptor plug domain-containing protein n=1 Tax=uncultured Desulfobacter sp. TaxID=240139 RepID=UPI002AABE5EA|nr:TonB-dependent receptor [uncultured Desulfobacter sp.]
MRKEGVGLSKILMLMCTVALMLCTDSALGAETVQEIEGEQVWGRRIEERLSSELQEFGHQVTIIRGEEMEKAGIVDLQQALETMVPGFYVAPKTSRGDYSNFRLHGSSNILWLLDGVRLNNRLYGAGYLDSISIRTVDRIEILKGGEGLFYGTDATGGVVNIITKSVSKDVTGQAGASIGTKDYKDLYGHVSDSFNGHGFMVFGSHEGWEGYYPFNDEDTQRAGSANFRDREYDRTVTGIKYSKEFNLGERAVFKAHAQRNQGDFDYAYINGQTAVNDRTEDIAFLKWDHDVTKSFSYYLKTYIHRWWTDYTKQNADGTYVFNASEWGYQDTGVNLMGSFSFEQGHELLMGGDYQNYWARDEVWQIADKREEVYALFAQIRPYLSFSPRTRIALGTRYNTTDETDKLIWNVSVRTPINGPLYFRGMVGTSFCLPTAEQLYLDEDGSYGNPDLEPEESFNIDLGLGATMGRFDGEIGYYYQKIDNMISSVDDGSGDYTFENTDDQTTIKGVELQFNARITNQIRLLTSYTYAHARKGDSDEQIADTPEWYAKAALQCRHSSGNFGLDLQTRYIGDTCSSYTDGNGDPEEYGNYFVADMSGFVRFGRHSRHRITLRLENLLDNEYTTRQNRIRDADTGDYFVYDWLSAGFLATIGYSYSF